MQMTRTLNLALQDVTQAARQASQSAKTLEALGTLLKEATSGVPSLDVDSLARLLLTLGLCIVHRDVVGQAMEIVKQTDDAEGLSYDQLANLQERLQLAYLGTAIRNGELRGEG